MLFDNGIEVCTISAMRQFDVAEEASTAIILDSMLSGLTSVIESQVLCDGILMLWLLSYPYG